MVVYLGKTSDFEAHVLPLRVEPDEGFALVNGVSEAVLPLRVGSTSDFEAHVLPLRGTFAVRAMLRNLSHAKAMDFVTTRLKLHNSSTLI